MSKLKDKKTLGIPEAQLWREMGYDEQKIAAMQADKKAAAEELFKRQSQLTGNGGQDGTQSQEN